jgi:hypothetical protein
MNSRKIQYWVIPPKHDAEFVANMEEVVEVYERPYDSNHPFFCMDEQPVQLIKETRTPIPATANHPERVDYERVLKRKCYLYAKSTSYEFLRFAANSLKLREKQEVVSTPLCRFQ